MTVRIVLKQPASLAEFREHVRGLISGHVAPRDVTWADAGDDDLFGNAPPIASTKTVKFTVPSAFVDLARDVLRNRDSQRHALLYTLLWRLLHEDRMLLSVFSDPLVYRLRQMQKSVHRDLHKMTAFVRFRQVDDADGERFIAWFEPQHLILEAASEFFVKRFANMRWSILTPDSTLHWDTHTLSTGAAVPKSQAPTEDGMEEWWKSYYRSTFNPARVNPTMMRSEMPKKYWKNLPEAALIPDMIAGARQRTGGMLEAPPTAPRAVVMRDFFAAEPAPVAGSLEALRKEASSCQRCPLHCAATQTVFGEGPADAPVVFVGEQAGDQEDLAGRPFIGPAGQLFDRALAEAGILRERVYVTNAVKHFKFEPRGKRRIHQKPNTSEIEHCRWWLDLELKLVRPKLVVALGATAMRALTGKSVAVTQVRGQRLTLRDGMTLSATVHPSYVLRLPDKAAQEAEYRRFVADLASVPKFLPAVARAA